MGLRLIVTAVDAIEEKEETTEQNGDRNYA